MDKNDTGLYGFDLFRAEEHSSEQVVNNVRFFVTFVFLAVTLTVYKQLPWQSVYTLVTGTIAFFSYSLFMVFYLRSGRYTPSLKYISICFDVLTTTTILWSFGTFRTFKTEAFFIYLIWIAMSAMRFSRGLTFLAGGLTIGSYLLLIYLALHNHTIETGSITESFTSSKVSLLNLGLRITFLVVVVLVLSYVARVNRKLINTSLESEAKFRGLVEHSVVGVYILQGGKLRYVNPTFAHIFGYSAEELVGGLRLLDLIAPADRPRLEEALASGSGGWSGGVLSCLALRKDGAEINIELSAATTEFSGKPAVIGTLSDVTERLKAERELLDKTREMVRLQEEASRIAALSKLKSEFLANMSHELRTPLNAVIGLSQVMGEETYGPINQKQREYMDAILQSSRHLLSLINEILDLAKIESGREQLNRSAFPLAETLRSSLALVREKALRSSLTLSHEIDPSLGYFYADERRVKQILYNLLSNAVKFTSEGGAVTLSARLLEGWVEIVVKDTGLGIAPEKVPSIFEPFSQVDSSLNRRHEGTGLGLTLTRSLVEMHGGEISVQSELGKGSAFTVRLPAVDIASFGEPGGLELMRQRTEEAGRKLKGRRVLVVEDNPLNMMLLVDFLKDNGLETQEARDGHTALSLASFEPPPELIMLDIQMPGLDGLEVTRRLKASDSTKGIPVIAITALAMKGDEQRCYEAGCDGYLTKPVDLETLLISLARHLPERA